MRILYVITKANWGGAQRYVYDLATAARDAGNEVAVAYGDEGALSRRLREEGIRTEQVAGLTRDIGIGRDIRSFFQLVRLFKQERPGVVHINSSKAGGLGALAARIAGVPLVIFTAHGWAFNEDRPGWQKIIIYKLAWLTILLSHRTICVSNAILRDVAWMPFAHSKCTVVYNGVSCDDLFSREAARATLAPHTVAHYWVGMLSELHPTKRVGDAIRAFAAIAERHPEAVLFIISDGELRAELEQLIRDLHLNRRVVLLGAVTDARRYLRAFDIFVHVSISEALGLAILEAGCASLPVIATRVGGVPEIISDDSCGVLVPPRDHEALAAAIETLMDEPLRAADLGARLRARVQASFSKQAMLSETLALYR